MPDPNIVKVDQLIIDARTKARDAEENKEVRNASYWHGFEDGLKRAKMVLEGKG